MKRLLLTALVFVLAGCSHKSAQVVKVPSAPPPEQRAPQGTPPVEAGRGQLPETPPPPPAAEVGPEEKPSFVETGIASWYGAPYHNRRGSNGEIYDMHAMTAAHRTLPLGSVVRVTSLRSGGSVVVRITDRGPFITGRIIDLSQAAADKIGLIPRGTGQVRVELLQAPEPLDTGGRWAVQIGGFGREERAREVAGQLSRRYRTAQILTFNSPVGDWWVRVRVKGDVRARAEEVLRDNRTPEGAAFLVRLD